MESKRAAEKYLKSLSFSLEEQPESITQYREIPKLMENLKIREQLWSVRPMPVEAVATAAFVCAIRGDLGGIFDVNDIERLKTTNFDNLL